MADKTAKMDSSLKTEQLYIRLYKQAVIIIRGFSILPVLLIIIIIFLY